MNYTCSVIIDLPRDQVISFLNTLEISPAKKKQIKYLETFEGDTGMQGATSKLYYESGERKVEMVETIVKLQLPEMIHATYWVKDIWSQCENTFIDSGGKTRWTLNADFRFNGFMKYYNRLIKKSVLRKMRAEMDMIKYLAEMHSISDSTTDKMSNSESSME